MRELLTVVTRKGQITVPAEIRRALGLQQGDKVAVVLENDQVRLRRVGSVVARTAGVFRGTAGPLTGEELREIAEEAISEDVVERSAS
jgi:antitoxin PrlF